MENQFETDAELLEQIKANLRPIRDGSAPFYDDPDDIAWHLKDNAIRNIEAGQPYITEVTLPYLEIEAISRMEKRMGLMVDAPDRRKEPDLWRAKWVCEALCLERHLSGYDPIAQAAVRVLITASKLRAAIDRSDMQMIAALSMLLGCEVFAGGYSLAFEAAKRTAKTLAAKPRQTATLGGRGKADKYRPLESETIRLFNEGSWETIGAAALEILPKIIKYGRENGFHVLSVTSKKPFEWISTYKKSISVKV